MHRFQLNMHRYTHIDASLYPYRCIEIKLTCIVMVLSMHRITMIDTSLSVKLLSQYSWIPRYVTIICGAGNKKKEIEISNNGLLIQH